MANLRNPLFVSTTVTTNSPSGVNVEKVIAVEKTATSGIVFIYDYNKPEKNVIWQYADDTDRDAEFVLLTVASDDFSDAVTPLDAAFVVPSVATVNGGTGKPSLSVAVNVNSVAAISKVDKVTFMGIGGKDVFGIVFTYDAIDTLKVVEWYFLTDVDRDAVFAELTVVAADALYIS